MMKIIAHCQRALLVHQQMLGQHLEHRMLSLICNEDVISLKPISTDSEI